MSDTERRDSNRRVAHCPGSLMTEPTQLDGEILNISSHGVLLRAHGRIPVLFRFEGTEYRGRLVRASLVHGELTAYAIELELGLGGVHD